ncbi:pentapeptide repeat-containing protein [Helicobacter pullorum]
MFLNYLADNKNNTTIIRDRDKIIVNEEIFIIFNESLKNKHFNFSDIVFNKTVTFQTNRENGLEFNFENTYFEKLNILNCDVDNIIFSGEINYIKESNISECKIKGVTINSNIEGDVKFQKCIFEDFNKYNSGKNIKFGANFVFDFCETEDITNLMNFDFENRVSFKMSKFKNNIYFNNSYFKDSADFHECEFEKTACFYGVKFDKVPNFSQVQFKGSLNAVNTNLNFGFESLKEKIKQEHIEYNKRESIKKPLAHFANDFRDSFRIFKSTLIKDNNLLDASNFHKYELYSKEIELVSKENKTIKDKVEKWQLWFYRKLCDHHTDLVLNLKWLVYTIALYVLLLGKIPYVYPVAIFVFCVYVYMCSFKNIWLVVSSAIVFITILDTPKIILGISNLFEKDLNLWQNFITTLYVIAIGLVLFSLQKTARKNSIVPN